MDHLGGAAAVRQAVPLVGREARHDEEREAHEQVGRQHVDPDLHGQGVHEGEEARWL